MVKTTPKFEIYNKGIVIYKDEKNIYYNHLTETKNKNKTISIRSNYYHCYLTRNGQKRGLHKINKRELEEMLKDKIKVRNIVVTHLFKEKYIYLSMGDIGEIIFI